mgnify:CR=1 FL=1
MAHAARTGWGGPIPACYPSLERRHTPEEELGLDIRFLSPTAIEQHSVTHAQFVPTHFIDHGRPFWWDVLYLACQRTRRSEARLPWDGTVVDRSETTRGVRPAAWTAPTASASVRSTSPPGTWTSVVPAYTRCGSSGSILEVWILASTSITCVESRNTEILKKLSLQEYRK